MAWPPPVLPINRTNADPQQDLHPADHNAIALAINDTVAQIRATFRVVQSVTDVRAWLATDGAIATVISEAGYSPFVRNAGVWNGERVIQSITSTDAGGMFFITAAVAGFTTITHADVMVSLGFPGSGAVTNAHWSRLSANQIEVQVIDIPSGNPPPNRSMSYTARIRGYL